VVLLVASSLRASDEFEFAVPDEGRITLGVFDGSGKLVRLLHRLAKEEDFRAGLNGLITSWDGKNDAGEHVTSGHYHMRGYLVGDGVRVSGENFLFNDWAADNAFPGFNSIKDYSLLENGDVVLLAGAGPNGTSTGGMAAVPSHISDRAENKWALTAQRPPDDADGVPTQNPDKAAPFRDVPSGHVLARFSPDKGFAWSSEIRPTAAVPTRPGTDPVGRPLERRIILGPMPFHPQHSLLLAANSSNAFVITEEGMNLFALDDGKTGDRIPRGSQLAPTAVAANESRVFISSRDGVTEATLPDLSQEKITLREFKFTSMDADASTLIGLSKDDVFIRQDSFAHVPLPVPVKSVALGMPGTFWFVGVEKDVPFVSQASFSGEILRTLRPAAEDPKPEKIRASQTAEKFAVIESLPGLQRLRVMARAESGGWTIEWERTLRESANFGFVDGKPAADAGGAAQEKEIRVRLKENPLTGKHDFLTVRVEFDASGSRLVSPDRLPLVEVSTRNDIRRTAIHGGDNPDSLRLLQGNGSFVEEFSISGLDDILPLDAGGIDIP